MENNHNFSNLSFSKHENSTTKPSNAKLLGTIAALLGILLIVVVLVVIGFPRLTRSLNTSLSDNRPLLGTIISKLDFDTDGKADIAVWRPSEGAFYILLSSKAYDTKKAIMIPWGKLGDIQVTGKFFSNSSPDLAVWRPSDGTWYILTGDSKFKEYKEIHWGIAGDVPIGYLDFDGDGKSDMAVFRPSEGKWYILLSSKNFDPKQSLTIAWGKDGDVPF